MAFGGQQEFEHLDESDAVSDRHLALIAEKISRWEDKLAYLLGLKEPDVVMIKKNHCYDYNQQKLQCLLRWKQLCGHMQSFSYGYLMKHVKDCGLSDACSYISQLLNYPGGQQSSENCRSTQHSPDSSENHSNSSDHSNPKASNNPHERKNSLQRERRPQRIDSGVLLDLEYMLRENLREIHNRYSHYVQYILVSLKEKNVGLENLRSYILNLPAFIDTSSRKTMLWTGSNVDFAGANSINDIFNILVRDCCSFLDCNIFEQIMAEYGVDTSNKTVTMYYDDLKKYVEKHKASEFAMINPSLNKLASSSTEMHLKFDIDETTCRLGDIKELKQAVARILGLRPSVLTILDIQEGCIILTLLVPTSVAEVLFNSETSFSAEQVQQFQDISMMWMQCRSYMFDFKQEIEPEMTLAVSDKIVEMPTPVRRVEFDPDFREAVVTFNKVQSTIKELLPVREETLVSLQSLKDAIEKSYDKSRKAMIGGSATAIGGSVLGIVGFSLAPVTFGASLGLGIVGGVVAAAGGVAIARAEIGYTAVSRKMLKKVNISCTTDAALMQQLQDSGMKLEELLIILTKRYCTSPESMFQLFHRNTHRKVLDGFIHTGRITKTATSTTRALLAGSRTVWATLRPAIRVFGVVSAAIDAVFIPIDIGILIKSSYDVHKYKKGESNSNAAKEVQKLIDSLSTHRDKLKAACDDLEDQEAAEYQTRDQFCDYVDHFMERHPTIVNQT